MLYFIASSCYIRIIFLNFNDIVANYSVKLNRAKMTNQSSQVKLKLCNDDAEFFDLLEQCVPIKIPTQLKKILQINFYNSAVALRRYDEWKK